MWIDAGDQDFDQDFAVRWGGDWAVDEMEVGADGAKDESFLQHAGWLGLVMRRWLTEWYDSKK